MHPKPIATTLLLYAVGTLGVSFVAYSDNFCQKPITMRANDSEVVNELSIDRTITDDFHAYGRYYDGVTFEGAEPASSTGTMRMVYWKMRDPDPSCIAFLMRAFDRDFNRYTFSKRVEEIIILGHREGCYYSTLDNNTSLTTTFCCWRVTAKIC